VRRLRGRGCRAPLLQSTTAALLRRKQPNESSAGTPTGEAAKPDKELVLYRVRSLKELTVVINYFFYNKKYPLLTSVRAEQRKA
jgi:hypothetical protein